MKSNILQLRFLAKQFENANYYSNTYWTSLKDITIFYLYRILNLDQSKCKHICKILLTIDNIDLKIKKDISNFYKYYREIASEITSITNVIDMGDNM
jgi:hypothetical protein